MRLFNLVQSGKAFVGSNWWVLSTTIHSPIGRGWRPFHSNVSSFASRNAMDLCSALTVQQSAGTAPRGCRDGCVLHRNSSSMAGSVSPEEQRKQLCDSMTIRMMTENSFLSWCRNGYLSTVVGVAMMTEATSTLAAGAGAGAFVVGGMNLFWGTGCHVTNLIRLRHVAGMSNMTLFLNVLGSIVHFFLWLFVVICYIGFLDESPPPGTGSEQRARTASFSTDNISGAKV